MPPSGFSQEAINGLLGFVSSTYKKTLKRYKGQNFKEKAVLEKAVSYINGIVMASVPLAISGTVSKEGAAGLAKFVTTNFKDLVAEIESGKKTEGQAMQAEIEDIGKYLAQFSLH